MFCGVFDGNEHSITLNIELDTTENIGLFGGTESATIKNTTVKGYVSGYYGVGGIVGLAYETNIVNCTNEAEISGFYEVGGIVGAVFDSKILGCINEAGISGVFSVGGIGGVLDIQMLRTARTTGM